MELEQGKYYHIYNRGNNRENLFYENRNYDYFLQQYTKHIVPIAETFAYCLMKNHFHVLVRIKDDRLDKSQRLVKSSLVTNKFRNFFISYAKAINKAYGQTGALFQRPFGRREVTSNEYFAWLVHYIHFNPQKHGFVKNFQTYLYSSYSIIHSGQSNVVDRDKVLEWFGGKEAFIEFHNQMTNEFAIMNLIDED
ncbi:MAG: transposase [Ignavibacteriales bacterium]|nr:transposase [Ignavibacteriales bacterium]